MQDKLLLTVKEASETLGLSRGKTYELIWAKEIPIVRFGKSIRVPVKALEEYIEKNTKVKEFQPVEA